jgi:hypothetical protein
MLPTSESEQETRRKDEVAYTRILDNLSGGGRLRQIALGAEECNLHDEFLERYVENVKQRARSTRQRIAHTRESRRKTGSPNRALEPGCTTGIWLPTLYGELRELEEEFEECMAGELESIVFPSATEDSENDKGRGADATDLITVDRNMKDKFVDDLEDNYKATVDILSEDLGSRPPESEVGVAVSRYFEQLQSQLDDARETFYPKTKYEPLECPLTTSIDCSSCSETADSVGQGDSRSFA